MAAQDKGEQDANLIAAAEAAASWARARRATWTSAPPQGAKQPREPLPPIEFESPLARPPAPPAPPPAARPPQPRQVPAPAPIVLAPQQPIVLAPFDARESERPRTTPPTASIPVGQPIALAPLDPHESERLHRTASPRAIDASSTPFVASGRGHSFEDRGPSTSVTTWIARIGAAAAIIGAGVLGWPYVSGKLTSVLDTPETSAPADAGTKAVSRKGTGTLKIESTPKGAQVQVDGKPRGVTPLTLKDMPVGKHEVLLQSDAGSVRRTVTIEANQTESVEEQIFAGWVTVYSPFDVAIAEGTRVLRPDDRNQFMLSPGIHELRLLNKTLAYEAVLQVDVKPGEGTTVRLTPAPSSLTVTAPEAAEVLVDGAKAGETPLNNFSVPLGTHDVVVRRANGNEKHYTVTVGVKPFTLNAEF